MLSQYFFLAIYSVCVFVLVILWLQSGFDKLFHFKDNLSWLQAHFSKSPLKNIVQPMLISITIIELLAGLSCLAAIVDIWILHLWYPAIIACFLSMLALSLLFMGQRLAKDYAGAATLISYMLYTLFIFAFTIGLMLFIVPDSKTISNNFILPSS